VSPAISAHKFLIFKYDLNSSSDNNDLLIDYVHLRRQGEICELKALVFSAADFANTETHANVAIKVMKARIALGNVCAVFAPEKVSG